MMTHRISPMLLSPLALRAAAVAILATAWAPSASAMTCTNATLISEGTNTTRCYIDGQHSAFIEDEGDGAVRINTESDQGDVGVGYTVMTNGGDFLFLVQNGVYLTAEWDEAYVTAFTVYTDSGEDVIYLRDVRGPVTVSNANSGVGTAADTIWTGDYDDVVYLDDTDGHVVTAEDGDDVVYGSEGADTIYADAGDDVVYAGGGDDYIEGSTGEDDLRGGEGDDYIYGGEDGDDLRGGAEDDYIYGGNDRDEMRGAAGDDVLMGGDGDDLLRGGSGFNMLHGESGDDTLNGGESAICYSGATYTKCGTEVDSDSTDYDSDGFDWLEDCDDFDPWVGSDDECDGH